MGTRKAIGLGWKKRRDGRKRSQGVLEYAKPYKRALTLSLCWLVTRLNQGKDRDWILAWNPFLLPDVMSRSKCVLCWWYRWIGTRRWRSQNQEPLSMRTRFGLLVRGQDAQLHHLRHDPPSGTNALPVLNFCSRLGLTLHLQLQISYFSLGEKLVKGYGFQSFIVISVFTAKLRLSY